MGRVPSLRSAARPERPCPTEPLPPPNEPDTLRPGRRDTVHPWTRSARRAASPACSRSGSSSSTARWARCSRAHEFDEADFRGERFGDHPRDLRGDNDLLTLTQPGRGPRCTPLPGRRRRHHLDEHVHGDADRPGRLRPRRRGRPRDEHRGRPAGARGRGRRRGSRPGRPRFVAGALGPTNRTASIVAGRQRPGGAGRHAATSSRRPIARRPPRLVEGGADILLIETIFDTLNAKAAIFAVETLFDELG